MVATRSDSRRQVHQSIELAPFSVTPTTRFAAGFHVALSVSILAPCALPRSADRSVIDNRITLTRQRVCTRLSFSDELPHDHPCVFESFLFQGVENASWLPRDLLFPCDASLNISRSSRAIESNHQNSAHHREESRRPRRFLLNIVVHHSRSFVSYCGRHFAARDATPPCQGVRFPCRAAAGIGGARLRCGWT